MSLPFHERRHGRAISYASILFVVTAVSGASGQFQERILNRIFGEGETSWLVEAGVFLAFTAIFVAVSAYSLLKVEALIGSSVRMIPLDEHKPQRFLVMGFSPPDSQMKFDEISAEIATSGLDVVALPTSAYIEACKEKNVPALRTNKWQQNIRSIYHHRDTVEIIYVLVPDSNEETLRQFKAYVELAFRDVIAKRGLSNLVRVVTNRAGTGPFFVSDAFTPRPPSYEDYEYVFEGVRRAIDAIRSDNKAGEKAIFHQICVDATGGLKTFSIAAAIATLNANTVFSYVNNDGVPRFYDASVTLGRES